MPTILSISGLNKTYDTGHVALKNIDLDIEKGEIFALLGSNGAGKTTLIGIVCGLVRLTSGSVTVDGHDTVRDYRSARARIGLVPQELVTDMFERVIDTVNFTRGLFGKGKDPALVERVLRDLALWDKRNARIKELSGGMKRRVLIAKALAHEPEILFLDEPTAGVDVELRRDMWEMVRSLRDRGVTIILTTHYIEEAEEMADRIGVINKGELILVEEKRAMMEKLGKTTISIGLKAKLAAVPPEVTAMPVSLSDDGMTICYISRGENDQTSVADLIRTLDRLGIDFSTIDTRRSSLEDIFVDLIDGEQ